MAAISDQISLRTIPRSNSSSSHGRHSPSQEDSPLHSPVHSLLQPQREWLVQEQDITASVEHVEDGNETQPALSSLREPSNQSSIQEGKDTRLTSLRGATHWKTVGMILGFLFAALLSALGHHLLFTHLDHKLTDTSYLTQTQTSAISILLTTIFKAALTASVGICFAQHLWFILRRNAISLSAIEKLFVFRSNLLVLGDLRSICTAPLLFFMALLIWCLGIAMIYPPGALVVVIEASNYTENRNMSVMNPPVPQELDLGGNDTYPMLTSGGFYSTSYGNGSKIRYWDKGPAGYALFNIAKSILMNNQVRNLPNHPGENSTYYLQFQGPQFRCISVSYNNTYALDRNYSLPPEQYLLGPAPAFASTWDRDWQWDRNSRDAPLYSVAKHTALTYTYRLTSQDELIMEVLRATTELKCKPHTALYDVKVSFPRGIQTVEYNTSDVKPLSPIGVYSDTPVNHYVTNGYHNWSVSLDLPADTRALEDWNYRMRIILSLYNEWTLLEALGSLLQDEIYTSFLRGTPRPDDLWCNKGNRVVINGTELFDCSSWDMVSSSEMNTSSSLQGTVFDTSRNDPYTDQGPIDPRLDPRTYFNVTEDLLNSVLANIIISAISLDTWWDMVPITTTRYQSTYSFANPLNLVLPYSICLVAATAFAAIAIWSLSRNGTPAADGGFLQIMTATRGNTEMERLVLREKLTTVENMSLELKALKVRYGELVREDVVGVDGRTMGFGTIEETISLRKRK